MSCGLHQALVDELVQARGLKTQKFRVAVLDVVVASYRASVSEEFPQRVPDAYSVDEETKKVVAYEVEHYNRLSIEKLRDYCYLWSLLDERTDWEFGVTQIDRAKNEHVLNLCDGFDYFLACEGLEHDPTLGGFWAHQNLGPMGGTESLLSAATIIEGQA